MNIFYINIENFNIENADLRSMVNSDKKFLSYQKEKQHLLGRYLIAKAGKDFFKIENTELKIINNKPRFKYSNIQFSISHSQNIVLAAFDKNPVGVDIEFMKQRNFYEILKRYNFKNPNASKEQFYEFWTEYEAGIKLQGTPQTKISFTFLNNFMLTVAGNFEKEFKIFELKEDAFVQI